MIAPQFKTWFYIYRNNSAEEEFKKILAEDYLVEIKDIDRFDYDFDSPRTAEQKSEGDLQKLPTNSKDVTQFDDLKNTEPKGDGNIDGFETLKFANELPSPVDQAIADYNQLDQEEKGKVSKFDKHVDEAQYVEVPEIKKEIKEDKKNTEKEHLKKKLQKENEGPEKVTLPLKKYMEDSMEIMEAQENRHFTSRVSTFEKHEKPVLKFLSFQFGRAQPLHLKDDVTSALSGNSIVGRKGGESTESSSLESKMLLFNGLYFRGSWAQPFMELRSDEQKHFNALSGKQENVKFMMTHGLFKFAEIPEKKMTVVEMPYKV